jgi:hypothetical protein
MHPNQKKEQLVNLLDATPMNSKAVTHVTSHGQYSNVVAHKTKEGEIVPHVCCNT